MRVLIVTITMLIVTPAFAFTEQQARACYPDAIRLCGAPTDYHRIAGAEQQKQLYKCMVAHAFALSSGCLSAFLTRSEK